MTDQLPTFRAADAPDTLTAAAPLVPIEYTPALVVFGIVAAICVSLYCHRRSSRGVSQFVGFRR